VRRRGLRVFALIFVVVALGIASLSFREVHISVPGFFDIDRDASGPLGLSLGLDLEGGSDLRYQADLPDQVALEFEEAVDEADLVDLLQELGQTKAAIAKPEFVLNDLSLRQLSETALSQRLEAEVALIGSIEFQDDGLEVAFLSTADEGTISLTLAQLGYQDAVLETIGENQFSVRGLAFLETAENQIKEAMEERLSATDSFLLTGDSVQVTFSNLLRSDEVQDFLDEVGLVGATFEAPDQTRFRIEGLALDDAARRDALRDAVAGVAPVALFTPSVQQPTEDQIKGVVDIIQRRINALGTTEPIIQRWGTDRVVVQLPGSEGSTIDIAFRPVPSTIDFTDIFRAVGRTGDTVDNPELNTFVINTEQPFTEDEFSSISQFVAQIFAPVESFTTGDEGKQITAVFVPPLNQSGIERLLDELGYVDYTVELVSRDRYLINIKDAITTDGRASLRDGLEGDPSRLALFNTTGGVEDAKQLIGQTAQLTFFERECLVTLEELSVSPLACEPLELGGEGRYNDLPVDITGEDLSDAYAQRNPTTNANEVNLEFKGKAVGIWSDLTRRLVGDQLRRIAIYRDDEQLTAPIVSGHSPDGRTRITGHFTREEAQTLGIQLESGSLDVPLELIREDTVDALLGEDSLKNSLVAGLVGLGLVFLFMIAYYRVAGLVAVTALIVYGIIVLSIFKLLPVTLTLSGIAGLVLSIGIAVDANILIFERMKEEMRTGRSLTSSMEVGFRRAWTAIRDSNVSTIITCLILWWFGSRTGTPIVTGFALTLGIGVIISMFTAMTVSRNMLQLLAYTPMGSRINLFTPEPPRRPVAAGRDSGPGGPGRRGGT
jgi:protein-export membrane protein SecD